MNIEKVQNIASQLADISSNNDAMINILKGYCENIQEYPSSQNLFDILVILNLMKGYSYKTRHLVEQIDNSIVS